jgi:hypothetical protein
VDNDQPIPLNVVASPKGSLGPRRSSTRVEPFPRLNPKLLS